MSTPQVTGSSAAANTSVSLPPHRAGDLILLWLFTYASNTPPAAPASSGTVPAWNIIDSSIGTVGAAARTACAVATEDNHTSGVWTGATNIVAAVVRGQNISPIGGHAKGEGSNSAGATAPAITLSNDDGSSLLLHFFGVAAVPTWSAAPAGYTQVLATDRVCCDTKDDTTSDGAVLQAHSALGQQRFCGATVEVLAGNSGFFAVL